MAVDYDKLENQLRNDTMMRESVVVLAQEYKEDGMNYPAGLQAVVTDVAKLVTNQRNRLHDVRPELAATMALTYKDILDVLRIIKDWIMPFVKKKADADAERRRSVDNPELRVAICNAVQPWVAEVYNGQV